MSEPVRDRWLSIGMSVLLHGSLVALLAIGFWHFRRQAAPAPTVPIDATVVDARTLKGAGSASTPAPKPQKPPPPPQPQPQPQPEQAAPPPEGPPPPTADELAMREQAAKEEAQHEAQAQQELLARQQAKEAREAAQREAEAQAAAEASAAKQAEEVEAAAQAKKAAAARKVAEAKKKAAAAKLAAKKAAEQRKLAQEKKLAEEKALAAQRQAEAERAARVADLQRSLREDESAAAASGALASWQSELESRIQQRWIRPPTAQQGIDCVLNVSLVSGGDVTDVSIGQCNGDAAVRESIKNAVYAASPLPPPPNNVAFPHQLVIEFKPTN